MLLESILEKEICVSNTWLKSGRRVKLRLVKYEIEIDFMLMRKEHQWVLRNVKAILGENEHTLVAEGIDKRNSKKIVTKIYAEKRICL